MITGTAAAIILGALLATVYGAGFHLIMGGSLRHLLYYLPLSWLGFIVGHFLGDMLQINFLKLGALYLASASAGAWLALFGAWWLLATPEGDETRGS
jgi:hypothetical protein